MSTNLHFTIEIDTVLSKTLQKNNKYYNLGICRQKHKRNALTKRI